MSLAVLAAAGLASEWVGGGHAAGQQAPHQDSVYATLPTATGPAAVAEAAAEDPVARQQRRARVAARAGDVAVTVGELEDYVGRSPRNVQDNFRTPAGRRGVVERVLRGHLLAIEAERRGVIDEATRHRARRAEERVLRDLLETEVREDPGSIPPPSPPVVIPEERFAVILRTDSREVAETWAREVANTPFTQALARANEVGRGQETPYGVAGSPPDASPAIEAPLWRALFELDAIGRTSRSMSLGGGQFAVVFEAGLRGGGTETGPDERTRRMLAGERAWQELVTQVREDRVSSFEPEQLDGVAFRMSPDRSRESMDALAAEIARVRAAREAAGEGGE